MSAATEQATVGFAMYAVAQHMLDHQLPAPTTIDAPRLMLGERAVIVFVESHGVNRWLDSMIVEAERVVAAENVKGLEHLTYDGRIDTAVGEISVQLRSSRMRLHVIGGAS